MANLSTYISIELGSSPSLYFTIRHLPDGETKLGIIGAHCEMTARVPSQSGLQQYAISFQ